MGRAVVSKVDGRGKASNSLFYFQYLGRECSRTRGVKGGGGSNRGRTGGGAYSEWGEGGV